MGFRLPLDPRTEHSLRRFGPIVRKYAHRYDLDWRLVLAVMRQESSFQPEAVSHKGAYGLMQLMPTTQSELAEKLGMEETESPYNNIRAGIFHLRTLFRVFDGVPEEDRIRLSLAAYNAGLGRVFDAQDLAAYLGEDPNSWAAVEAAMPLLSKRYYTLHERVWEMGKPRTGYFGDWRQTVNYVRKIMVYYREYQLALQ